MGELKSFGAFAERLARISLEGEAVSHEIAKKAANLIQRDARAKLGHYQDASRGFNAWPELADSTKEDRVNKGFSENEPLLRTGELRESITTEVKGSTAIIGSMDPIALWQEMGTDDGHIPPRPFLGPAAFEDKPKIEAIGANTLIGWLSGRSWRHPRRILTAPKSEE